MRATHSGATIPFGALAHLLPVLAGPGFGPVEAMRAICSHVSGWGGRTRVALGIDDAHLLDDASAATVAHVVTRSVAFVILTARFGEPLPDALVRLCKDDLADTLIVAPLPDDVVDRLIDHSRAGRIDTLERRRLRRAAQGNPLACASCCTARWPVGLPTWSPPDWTRCPRRPAGWWSSSPAASRCR